MKLTLAFLAWIVMGILLAKGLLMAVHGSFWLLLIGMFVFIALMAKIGCLSHDT